MDHRGLATIAQRQTMMQRALFFQELCIAYRVPKVPANPPPKWMESRVAHFDPGSLLGAGYGRVVATKRVPRKANRVGSG